MDHAIDFLLDTTIKDDYRSFPTLSLNSKFGNDILSKEDILFTSSKLSLISSTSVVSRYDIENGSKREEKRMSLSKSTLNISPTATIRMDSIKANYQQRILFHSIF